MEMRAAFIPPLLASFVPLAPPPPRIQSHGLHPTPIRLSRSSSVASAASSATVASSTPRLLSRASTSAAASSAARAAANPQSSATRVARMRRTLWCERRAWASAAAAES
eukprot:scaffold9922_cov86-Isochrysis_galbana.AAC.1